MVITIKKTNNMADVKDLYNDETPLGHELDENLIDEDDFDEEEFLDEDEDEEDFDDDEE